MWMVVGWSLVHFKTHPLTSSLCVLYNSHLCCRNQPESVEMLGKQLTVHHAYTLSCVLHLRIFLERDSQVKSNAIWFKMWTSCSKYCSSSFCSKAERMNVFSFLIAVCRMVATISYKYLTWFGGHRTVMHCLLPLSKCERGWGCLQMFAKLSITVPMPPIYFHCYILYLFSH